jgi:hypothetical protein
MGLPVPVYGNSTAPLVEVTATFAQTQGAGNSAAPPAGLSATSAQTQRSCGSPAPLVEAPATIAYPPRVSAHTANAAIAARSFQPICFNIVFVSYV